ncbi:hypothetical protein KGF57_000571 [Candida theae]|uniref:Inner centromere protein ARK-binding domain-containing protein n=1 Tax=Candida theae TaxID=1198502 RepID=A0AAD5BIK0_9ASCO|nr:uncharacterized protein KGF57_000571 [Candida theae]KAI5966607.1 hypothetical protein KGF57_000571 [Candida theae]
MSKWAIDATNRIRSEVVSGSSKYILHELSEQFELASASIENHYLRVRNDANKLESWMSKVLDREEEIDELLGESSSPKRGRAPVQSSPKKTSIENILPSPKSREVTIKIPFQGDDLDDDCQRESMTGQAREGAKENKLIKESPTPIAIPKTKSSAKSMRIRITERDNSVESQSPKLPVTPKQSIHTLSDSDDSFQAISAAIKRSVMEKTSTLESNTKSNSQHTPGNSTSRFVPLPTRNPINKPKGLIQGSGGPFSTISVKNRFSPRRSPTPSSETSPNHDRSGTSLWDKIGEYRQMSPKKPHTPNPTMLSGESPPPKASASIANRSSNPRVSIRSSNPRVSIRSPKSTVPIANRSPTKPSPLRQPPLQNSLPAKVDLPQLKSPNLDRLTAPTAASAAKRKKHDAKKNENRFLTTTLQRSPRKFERAKSAKVMDKVVAEQPVQRSTKKSMMEQRSEAAKSRQKIVLNLRKSESKSVRDATPQTPKKFTPENLPEVLSDDNQSPHIPQDQQS